MYFLCILESLKTGKFYKGLTNNIQRRLQQHEDGKSPTTRSQLPVKLIHVEVYKTRLEAREAEKFFKSGYGREVIKELAELMR